MIQARVADTVRHLEWSISTNKRVRVPLVLQMEAVECGAACLAMILGSFGRYVTLEELRLACGVSRDGIKASNILRAAEQYGLRCKGFSKEPTSLPSLPLPLIVFWGFNHFVVVQGFGRKTVQIVDPSWGPRTVSNDEFDESFTGVVLAFRPGSKFEPGGTPPASLPALMQRAREVLPFLGLATAIGLGLVGIALLVPTLIKVYLDTYITNGSRQWIWPVLTGIGVATVLNAALGWAEGRVLVEMWRQTTIRTASQLFWHILRLPIPFFHQRHTAEIANRIGLNGELASLLSLELAQTILHVLVMVAYVVFMLQYDVLLTIVGLVCALINVVALWLVSARHITLNRRRALENGLLSAASVGGLSIIESLKASGAEDEFFARWSGFQARALNSERSVDLSSRTLDLLPGLLFTVASALVLLIGGLKIMQGVFTVGEIVAFQVLLASFLAPVGQLTGMASSVDLARADVERLDDVLRYQTDPVIPEMHEDLEAFSELKLTGQLELRGVSFGYSHLEPALIQALDLSLAPGRSVALVGGSGSGKSTVARIVNGLYEPWSGEILFDGKPRGMYPRAVLSAGVGSVDQECFIFEGTVRDNLTIWDKAVPDEQLERALTDACLRDDIRSLSGDLEGTLAAGGTDLSGGQRQRLEIARALLRDPRLLVLDEATSALDPLTEKTIISNLRRRGCALLLVAHRLSTVREADEIVVLDRGAVVERGTHPELLARGGAYARLVRAA